MTYIGIDPGQEGGVAFVWCADVPGSHAQPLPFNGKEFDAREFRRLLIGNYREDQGVFAVVERAQVMPRQGAVSGFTIGKNYGQILGVLSALGIPFETVVPRAWMPFSNSTLKEVQTACEFAMEMLRYVQRRTHRQVPHVSIVCRVGPPWGAAFGDQPRRDALFTSCPN